MPEYEKINTLYKRYMEKGPNKGRIIEGEYSKEEFRMINYWEVTEKIDGVNIRVELALCDTEDTPMVPFFWGRTYKAVIPTQLRTKLEKHFDKIELSKIFDMGKADNVTLYCEGYGAGIQKGGKYSDEQTFIMYDILIDDVWLEREKVEEFAKQLNMECVPLIGMMQTDEIVEFVKSKPKSHFGDFPLEGVVCRSKPLLLDRMGRRVAWKLKIVDFK